MIPEKVLRGNAGKLLLWQFLRRVSVGAALHKFSGAGELARGDRPQVFNVLTEQDAEFRENQPRVFVLGGDRK